MSVRNSDWWGTFAERVKQEPLAELATEYGADPTELEQGLAEDAKGQAVTESAWWPEAIRRLEAGGSLRAVARSFGTNPRRVRRGMARAGIRVAGQDVTEGNPALAAIRDRLGKEPDGDLAGAVGVSLEAVKGERRRLGIEAYRPPPRDPTPRQPTDPLERALLEEAEQGHRGRSGRPDSKPKRRRVIEIPQVIRRPRSSSVRQGLPTMRAPVPLADAPEADNSDKDTDSKRGRRRIVREAPSATSAEPARRARRGRTRLVRHDDTIVTDESEEPDEAPAPRRRRKRVSPHGEVKVVQAAEVDREDLSRMVKELVEDDEVAPAPLLPPVEAPPPAALDELDDTAAAAEAGPAARPEARSETPAPRSTTSTAAVTAVTAVAAVAAPPRPEVRAPLTNNVVALTPLTGPARGAPKSPSGRVLSFSGESMERRPSYGWQLIVDGRPLDVLVVAPDMVRAAEIAQGRLSSRELERTSITRIGPVLGA